MNNFVKYSPKLRLPTDFLKLAYTTIIKSFKAPQRAKKVNHEKNRSVMC